MARDFEKEIAVQEAKIEQFKAKRADYQKRSREMTRRIKAAEDEIEDIKAAMLFDAVKSSGQSPENWTRIYNYGLDKLHEQQSEQRGDQYGEPDGYGG